MFYLRLRLRQPLPTALFGHPGGIALQQGHRCASLAPSPHYPKILNPEPFAEQTLQFRHMMYAEHWLQSPTVESSHAACLISLSASNALPFFHTANVIAAILRAIVTRASSDRSPRANNSAYQDLNGS